MPGGPRLTNANGGRIAGRDGSTLSAALGAALAEQPRPKLTRRWRADVRQRLDATLSKAGEGWREELDGRWWPGHRGGAQRDDEHRARWCSAQETRIVL